MSGMELWPRTRAAEAALHWSRSAYSEFCELENGLSLSAECSADAKRLIRLRYRVFGSPR
jgi:hypothetical protein